MDSTAALTTDTVMKSFSLLLYGFHHSVACALGDYSLSIMITKVRTVSWPISYFSSPQKSESNTSGLTLREYFTGWKDTIKRE